MAYSPHNDGHLPSDSFVASTATLSLSIDATSQFRPALSDSSPHAARLRLRNAGFRAPLLPARRISPVMGNNASENLVSSSSLNDENAPFSGEKRRHRNLSISSGLVRGLGVLKELTNSSRGLRPPLTNVFQEPLEPSQQPAHGDENIPEAASDDQENAHATQMSSSYAPLAKSTRRRKKSRLSNRSASFEAQQYIEHLEAELTAANTKLDTLKSPETVTAQAAKIRSLNKQIQTLNQDLMDWQQNFEERVNDEIFNRTQGDDDIRLQLRILAETLAGKDAHISEIERDLEDTRGKLMESESAEKGLCRRIDVLTELLAKSPTRLSFSASSTPCTTDAPNPFASSKPLLLDRVPRLATTPTVNQHYSSSFDELFRGDQTESPTSCNFLKGPSPRITEGDQAESQHETSPSHSRSMSNADVSLPSGPSLSSRPTSMISNGSVSIPWGLLAMNEETRSTSKPRKSRRFATGSTTLKPLILPTTAMMPTSIPTSAPAGASYQTPCRRSMDYTTESSRVQAPRFSSSQASSTPSRPAHRRPKSWSQSPSSSRRVELRRSQTDNAVSLTGEVDCAFPPSENACFDDLSLPNQIEDDEAVAPLSAVSLDQELERALQSCGESRFSGSSPEEITLQSSNQSSAEKRLLEQDANATVRAKRPLSLASSPESNNDLSFVLSESTPRPPCWASSRENDGKRTSSLSKPLPPVSALSIPYLTSFVSSLRYRPYMLVKRIFLNSWMKGSTNVGGFGWWLLGLIISPRKRDQFDVSDREKYPSRTGHTDRFEEPTYENLDGLSFPVQNGPIMPLRGSIQLFPRSPGKQEYGPAGCVIHNHSKQSESHAHPSPKKSDPVRCPICVEPAGKRRLTVWARFSLALVLAVGVAILEGPEALLGEAASPGPHLTSTLETTRGIGVHEPERRREASEDTVQYTPHPLRSRSTTSRL